MASFFESITQSFTPDLLGPLGKAVGLDGPSTLKGLEVAGPLLTSALASKGSSPEGLDSLMGMVSQVGSSSAPGDFMKMFTSGASTNMLSGLFGSGLSAITGTLDRKLGFKVGPLLAMAAPFVMNQLSRKISAGGLDKAGVARFLQDEQKGFEAAGGNTAKLVQDALTAGREASTTRARYSSEQWNTVRLGPIAAAGMVIGASPSGAIGIAKEVVALGEAVTVLKKNASPTSLFSLLTDKDVTEDELNQLPKDQAAQMRLITNSVAAVETNSPVDAAGYRQFLVDLVTKVAEASKEGGFLGIGGTRVSAAEQSVIDQIKTAVGSGGQRAH
jgi:hypothetical protein